VGEGDGSRKRVISLCGSKKARIIHLFVVLSGREMCGLKVEEMKLYRCKRETAFEIEHINYTNK
jgi:hypothetical protein